MKSANNYLDTDLFLGTSSFSLPSEPRRFLMTCSPAAIAFLLLSADAVITDGDSQPSGGHLPETLYLTK